jgi:hypothetical protein
VYVLLVHTLHLDSVKVDACAKLEKADFSSIPVTMKAWQQKQRNKQRKFGKKRQSAHVLIFFRFSFFQVLESTPLRNGFGSTDTTDLRLQSGASGSSFTTWCAGTSPLRATSRSATPPSPSALECLPTAEI